MSNGAGVVLGDAHRQLLRALANGRSRSGSDLGRMLGISRSGVWKHVRFLQDLGLPIHAVSGVGYRLEQPLELLDAAAIGAALNTDAAGRIGTVYVLDVLDSTNSFLRERARQGVPTGSVCLTEMQTAGRGRMGRIWQSPFAGNIYLSVMWRYASPMLLGGLSLAVGALLVRALRAAGASGVALKWPNDLWWKERKLGGVLIEISGEMHGSCAVIIGVGINCCFPRRFAERVEQPVVDLARIPGMTGVSRNRLIGDLLNELLPALSQFDRSGFDAYADEWRRYHAHEGRAVFLETASGPIQGRIAGVDRSGALILERADGTRCAYSSGDVSLRVDGA